MENKINRGSIYYADFEKNNTSGSEQKGIRPVVIVQNNTGNEFSPTVIVVPITSKIDVKADLPTHILLKNYRYRMIKDSMLLTEQIRVIDKSRLKEYIGKLDEEEIKLMEKAILIALGININKILIDCNILRIIKEYIEITDEDYSELDIIILSLISYKNLEDSGNINIHTKEIFDYIKMLIIKFPKKEIWQMAKRKIDNKISNM